jgi:hypothetical protein
MRSQSREDPSTYNFSSPPLDLRSVSRSSILLELQSRGLHWAGGAHHGSFVSKGISTILKGIGPCFGCKQVDPGRRHTRSIICLAQEDSRKIQHVLRIMIILLALWTAQGVISRRESEVLEMAIIGRMMVLRARLQRHYDYIRTQHGR